MMKAERESSGALCFLLLLQATFAPLLATLCRQIFMQNSLSLHPSSTANDPPDIEQEIARLEAQLAERRGELATMQEELRQFKARYTEVVGSRLAELAEIERAVKEAEERALGIETTQDEETEEDPTTSDDSHAASAPVKSSLRRLFWSVAKVFHPDHAGDEEEARRRHSIMAEASRAYGEGDIDSLHDLLGDEQLQSYCASAHADDDPEDLAGRLVRLKEELRTAEFGIKRIKLDGLYRLKLTFDEEARHGRDALAEMGERIKRQIVKARRRLEHFP